MIHISGHGTPGELILETTAGQPDRVTAADLADLLDTARDRAKLVTIAACWSAAAVTVERLLLRLPVFEDQTRSAERPEPSAPPPPSSPGPLATELARRLKCAALAANTWS